MKQALIQAQADIEDTKWVIAGLKTDLDIEKDFNTHLQEELKETKVTLGAHKGMIQCYKQELKAKRVTLKMIRENRYPHVRAVPYENNRARRTRK
jgi:CxxC motif-containing protein